MKDNTPFQKPTLYIKNMVCTVCLRIVREKLEHLHLPYLDIQLGRVYLERELDDRERQQLQELLRENGFDLLLPKKSKLIEQIKALVHEVLNQEPVPRSILFSRYLVQRIGRDYSFLSKIFSQAEHITIEKYVIQQKVNRAKILLASPELSLSQIAGLLAYSSVNHLSAQFKQVTGYTPSQFRNLMGP